MTTSNSSSSSTVSNAHADATPTARRIELLEGAYRYVLEHGLTGLSLRPLASAINSSPRVLLFLFGSKDGLIRELLARARVDELQGLKQIRDPVGTPEVLWSWLVAAEHRSLLILWVETYARSLSEPEGPWGYFAAQTVEDWLDVLADRHVGRDNIDRTLLLAVLRGSLLDVLATNDINRSSAAVTRYLATFSQATT